MEVSNNTRLSLWWKGTKGLPTASKALQGCRERASRLSCCLKYVTCPLTSKLIMLHL